MIVYQGTKADFSEDVLADRLDEKVLKFFKKYLGHSTSKSEMQAWRHSMQYMHNVVNHPSIPDDCGVAIEYQIPQTSKRLDFILTGSGINNTECAILVELKQWSEASLSDKDAVIRSFVGGGVRELLHPSYQAWSYAALLYNYNETVQEDKIELKPCAFLHNYIPDDVIQHEHYKDHIAKAPVFLKGDALKLREFIAQYVKTGDRTKILYRIEKGKIRPSKMLADSMVSLLKGNQEFVMIDDQKLVYETALKLSQEATVNKKKVLIVKGGPGTGKSVVAINLLVELTKQRKLAQYVSKNAAPREVYQAKLTGSFKKTEISNMFRGSGGFVETKANVFDTLIVDEAHRLNEKSGLYGNLGHNQIKELIHSAICTVFFLDEDQRVTLKDIGSVEEIRRWAHREDAEVVEMELQSQFRCNGADGYLAWLDHVLQIRETANPTLEDINYDFRVFSSPTELRDAIIDKNSVNNKSRMVAGYCWKWNSKKKNSATDVIIPEHDFEMKWNLTEDGSKWIIAPESVNEIGCIHTCQGLEVDYVGVIIGPDLIAKDEQLITQPEKRDSADSTVRGYKKLLEKDPEEMAKRLSAIIKNTYRTLMTRGAKGCYVYFTDKGMEAYFKRKTSKNINHEEKF
jgi:uncharacterized protein